MTVTLHRGPVLVPSMLGLGLPQQVDHYLGTGPGEMVRAFAERLMAAELDTLCNAGYGEVTPERTNSRNGYRSRQLDRDCRVIW
jgi:transposase-like protein